MNEDKLLKKIQLLIKEEIRPVKDLVEITKKKVESQELHIHVTSENVRSVKEQQSVMNEKLDQHTEFLINIESSNNIYGDMYKMNNDNIRKLEKRLEPLEDRARIKPPPELILAKVQ